MHKSVLSAIWIDPTAWRLFFFFFFSACGACWADFTCCETHIMICNCLASPCDRRLSLVSKRHSHMFKIVQFHSVVQPRWYMGPPGLRFMALWTLLSGDKGSTVTVDEEEWVCFVGSQHCPRFLFPPMRHGPKCQPHHQEGINRKNDAALYNRLGLCQIYEQSVFLCCQHLKQMSARVTFV